MQKRFPQSNDLRRFQEQVKIFEGRLMSIDYNVITIKLHASLLTHMMFYLWAHYTNESKCKVM